MVISTGPSSRGSPSGRVWETVGPRRRARPGAPDTEPREGPIDGIQGLRAHLRSARPSLGGWANLREPRTAYTMAAAGLDWVGIDQQHGWNAGYDCTDLVAAVRAGGAHALVRVAWNRPEEIGRVLDAGAEGVIVPMVESAEEARAAVAAVRYAPEGRRSWGAARTPWTSTPPDASAANASTACLVMVESPAALADVAEIAAVAGVDGVFLGPFDLSLALGVPLPQLLADRSDGSPLRRVVAACAGNGIVAAAYGGTPARARLLREHGFTALAVGADDALFVDAAAAVVAQARAMG